MPIKSGETVNDWPEEEKLVPFWPMFSKSYVTAVADNVVKRKDNKVTVFFEQLFDFMIPPRINDLYNPMILM